VSCLLAAFVTIHPHPQDSVLSRFHFSDGRLKFLEGLLAENFVAVSLFMESTVYFPAGKSKFRVGAAHPAHSVDKSLSLLMTSLRVGESFYFHPHSHPKQSSSPTLLDD
jgi:hypothetical protein